MKTLNLLWLKCEFNSDRVSQGSSDSLEFPNKKRCLICENTKYHRKYKIRYRSEINLLTHIVTTTTTTKKLFSIIQNLPKSQQTLLSALPYLGPENDADRAGKKRGRIPRFCRCLLLQMVITVFTSTLAKYPHIIGEFCVNPGSSLSRKCQPRPPYSRLTHVISQEKKDGWVQKRKKKKRFTVKTCLTDVCAVHSRPWQWKCPKMDTSGALCQGWRDRPPLPVTGFEKVKQISLVVFIFSRKKIIEYANRNHGDEKDATVWVTKAKWKKKWYNFY